MIEFKGRLYKSPRISTTPAEGVLIIRIDDDANPELWAELRISETDLLRNLALVHRLTHGTIENVKLVWHLKDKP